MSLQPIQATPTQQQFDSTAQQLVKDKQNEQASNYQQDLDDGYNQYKASGGAESLIQFSADVEQALPNAASSLNASAADIEEVDKFLAQQQSETPSAQNTFHFQNPGKIG